MPTTTKDLNYKAHKVTPMISEILDTFGKAKSRQAKKEVLEKNKDVEVLRHLLRGIFDP